MSHQVIEVQIHPKANHARLTSSSVEVDEYDSEINSNDIRLRVTPTLSKHGNRREPPIDQQRRNFEAPAWSKLRRQWTFIGEDTWIQELFCLVISTGCLIALASLLFVFDEKALTTWSLSITLNAVLSIIITVMGAALALPLATCFGQLKWIMLKQKGHSLQRIQQLDSASRSVAGTFNLLFTFDIGVIGSMGSLLAILILFIGPFAQQIIGVSQRDVHNTSGGARIGTSTNFSDLVSTARNTEEASLPMRLAISRATLDYMSNGSFVNVSYTCPSGNCAWEPFIALGISSECQDVSSNLTKTLWPNSTGISFYTWSFPVDVGDPLTLTTMEQAAEPKYARGGLNMTWLPRGQSKPDPFARILIMKSSRDTSVSAYQCDFSYYLQRIEARIGQGLLMETRTVIPGTWYNTTQLDWYLQPASSNDNVHEHPPKFQINWLATVGLRTTFPKAISGSVVETVIYPAETHYDTDAAMALWQSDDISGHMAHIAERMSTQMREPISNGSQTVIGTVITTESYYQVTWPWFILPGVCVFSTALFSVILYIQTRRTGAPLWKNSLLAILFHGLDTFSVDSLLHDQDLSLAEHISGMGPAAESIVVRLKKNAQRGLSELSIVDS